MMAVSRDRDEEAGRWVVRLHSDQVTSEDERQFAAWLSQDPANGAAYDAQDALWAGMGTMRHAPFAAAMLADLREPTPRPARPTRRGLVAASLAGGTLATAGSWFGYQALFGTQAFATEIGEQRRIVLDDGSAVTLNTDSALRLRFTKDDRQLWLDRGQAFLSVTRDGGRPFRAFVGHDEVRSTGAAFEIWRRGPEARVTVEDGSVAIIRAPGPGSRETRPVLVAASQQFVATGKRAARIRGVDPRRTGAWRFGQMVLESTPLGTAVAELNRYNVRQIVIADPSLNDLAINGVFQTNRPEAFVEALTAAFPVRVERADEAAVYLGRPAVQALEGESTGV